MITYTSIWWYMYVYIYTNIHCIYINMDANKNIPSSYLYLPLSGHAFEVCHVNCCSRLINPNRITYPLQLLEMTPEKTSERVYPGCAESFTKRCIQVDPTISPIFLCVQPIGQYLSDLSLRWSNLIQVTIGKRRPFFCLSIPPNCCCDWRVALQQYPRIDFSNRKTSDAGSKNSWFPLGVPHKSIHTSLYQSQKSTFEVKPTVSSRN